MLEFNDVIVFSAGAILGYLVKTLIDHFLSKSRVTEDREIKGFNDAAESFREVFIPTMKALETDQSDRLILNQYFDLHDEARRRFEIYLKGSKLEGFREAWAQYENHCKTRTEVSPYDMFATEIIDPSRMRDPNHHAEVKEFRHNQAIVLIEALLKFSQRK